MKASPVFVYVGVSLLLVAWWGLAFRNERAAAPPAQGLHSKTPIAGKSDALLSRLDRDQLIDALSGNPKMMAHLIHEWDVDARQMSLQGIVGVRRLTDESLLDSQLLARTLQQNTVSRSKGRYLPQTYVAATFLLALCDPQQIVALPKGFRQQKTPFPAAMTAAVPLDIERHHSESLFLSGPDLAFIAPYSHPSTVEALRNQGISLFSIQSADTFEDICKVLDEIGGAVHRYEEAALLRIFMEGAMARLDNARAYAAHGAPLPKTLYVSYHSSFSLPTKKTLTGQLLMRMGILDQMEEQNMYVAQEQWSIPVDQEKIVNFKPDCLIISTDNPAGLKARIDNDPAFEGLRNACQRVEYIDEDVVNSPTQFIVLAYYDLLQAMIQR